MSIFPPPERAPRPDELSTATTAIVHFNYTAAALMRLLGLKSRDALHNNYLNPTIEEGFIQMTVPDKPTSRIQR